MFVLNNRTIVSSIWSVEKCFWSYFAPWVVCVWSRSGWTVV